jgi:sterol 3beta-glucosyltransferase
VNFIENGEKPVVVSLGSMVISGKKAEQRLKLFIETFEKTGLRAIIQGWDEAIKDANLPDTIFHIGSIPHYWLFPKASVIIHHGGFGTTAVALGSGVPGIIIPHAIDQFYWADQVYKLGAGPKFITRGKLNSSTLISAINQALNNIEMRNNAIELGKKLCLSLMG